jgi:Phytanoyl-CoA dioxygenase (PhyH)
MLTLPGRFEFLTEAWIAEAGAVLTREVERRREALGAKPFSVSERFTHAPPHLKFPDNAGAWRVDYDGERLSASVGFNPDADVVVEGDYQAALIMAQAVGALIPGVMAARLKEVQLRLGQDILRMRGALPPPASEVMGVMHDHMARRTMENPDLAHRAERLGLAGNIRELAEQGYTVIERAIPEDFADEVRAGIQRALASQNVIALNWMLYQGPEFERLAQNPLLMTLIDASLGRGAVIASLSALRRPPGAGFIPLHTDYAHVPEPYPEFAMTGVGVWAFEDWRVESGPTWIIPGTHKLRRPPKPGEGHNGGVPICMPKGSVVYFDHGVWHWQGDRTEPGERITLHAHFNRGILRSLEPKRTDVQLLHRNAPRLAEMLGEDDWFDKLSAEGRDYERFRYMNTLMTFNEEGRRRILEAA